MDIKAIREKFPILGREVNGRPLIYLDNTATSETPSEVVKEISWLYENTKANVHRGVHRLSQEATDLQEQTRRRVQKYINARSFDEIIFTRGTTEAINLVASSYGQRFKDGDEIILTVMEHHANIVPWQLLCSRADIKIRVVDINDRGELDLEQYRSLFNERTVFASFCHVSNVLGTVNPVKEMVEIAHSHNVPCLVDGAQASPHLPIDVADIGCDFYAFSSHKMYGPTGLGILYGRKELLEDMPPYQGGGEMISHVTFEHTTFADLPFKFEAGTPDFIGIAAFSKALDFIESTGLENIGMHEHELLKYTTGRLNQIEGLKIYGTAPDKSAVISFNVGNIHNYDIGLLLDRLGVAVRTGHHCAQPLMERLGVPGTVRASFAVYNTIEEADKFIEALQRVIPMLG
ncbi:MAG: cysteine desulfurase [Bacteroidales bacterium]|nr:cysteine desulfurase [Bacteroidales bacterium]